MIVNNPCIEFWFLMHFEKSAKFYDNCADAERQLKKYLPDYEKTQAYFTREGNDIFLRLQDKLPAAMKNAAALGDFDADIPRKAMTEMHKLFNAEHSLFKLASEDEETPC